MSILIVAENELVTSAQFKAANIILRYLHGKSTWAVVQDKRGVLQGAQHTSISFAMTQAGIRA